MSMRGHRHRHSRQASVDYPKYLPLGSNPQQAAADLMPAPTTLAPVVPSDYESDNQGGYASDYPVVQPSLTRTKEELNLTVLRRINPEIANILSIAPFVTLYEWAPGEEPGSEPGWQKTATVGSLFICQLTPGKFHEERYYALLLNRGGDKNFAAELRQSEDSSIEIQGDFVIVMQHEPDKKMELNALFIYAAEGTSTAASRSANGELMVKLANIAQMSRTAAEAHMAAQNGAHNQGEDTTPYHQQPPYMQDLHQPSLAPQIAPQPKRPLDLLALLQGQQSEPDRAPSHQTPPLSSTHGNNLLDLFRQASQQTPAAPSPATNVNDLLRQAGLKIG